MHIPYGQVHVLRRALVCPQVTWSAVEAEAAMAVVYRLCLLEETALLGRFLLAAAERLDRLASSLSASVAVPISRTRPRCAFTVGILFIVT